MIAGVLEAQARWYWHNCYMAKHGDERERERAIHILSDIARSNDSRLSPRAADILVSHWWEAPEEIGA